MINTNGNLEIIDHKDGVLATSDENSVIQIWDFKTGMKTYFLTESAMDLSSLMLLPDGRLLTYCLFHNINVWDLNTRKIVNKFYGKGRYIRIHNICNDGTLLINIDKKIQFLNLDTFKIVKEFDTNFSGISDIVVLENGDLAIATNSSIITMDSKTGKVYKIIKSSQCYYELIDRRLALIALQDRNLAIVYSVNRTVKVLIIDLDDETLLRPLDFIKNNISVNCLAFFRDNLLVSGNDNGTISFWDINTGSLVRHLTDSNSTDCITSLTAVSNNSIASLSGYKIIIWRYEHSILDIPLQE